jgi:hypothetical protein
MRPSSRLVLAIFACAPSVRSAPARAHRATCSVIEGTHHYPERACRLEARDATSWELEVSWRPGESLGGVLQASGSAFTFHGADRRRAAAIGPVVQMTMTGRTTTTRAILPGDRDYPADDVTAIMAIDGPARRAGAGWRIDLGTIDLDGKVVHQTLVVRPD